ncbi:MAG TPA: DUF6799 domain-containing protein [Flavisolibacter sp.]|jgi:major membrane immunogen (membrane-anchored lipoprotein)|nr:DUF6799 domain-containing protein [Flavisolibacter sp.]
MKKLLTIALAAFSLVACENANNTASTEDTTTTTTTTTSENAAYAPAEGDVTRRDGKVMVMRNGEWVEADRDVEMDNGVVVYKDGRVVRDGNEVELEDGEVVNKTGEFFDRTGRAIENAWDDAKQGVKKAAKEVDEAVDINTDRDRQ